MPRCPECDTAVALPTAPTLNEIVECGDCRTELELVSLEPPVMALAPEVEEDWGE